MSKSQKETKISAISDFIMKICSLERYIEIKRQMLCDKSDFEPYVAFQRLTRSGNSGITPSNIQRFLSENLIDVKIDRCRVLHGHYDSDLDGLLSYKEFLDIVLPKEHPNLRAYVTQRECYDIQDEEYFSYETEAAMAVLLERELAIFEEVLVQKDELDNLALSGFKIVEIISGSEKGNLNFKNLQSFLTNCGLVVYESEIINFLRRVDRDGDGVILPEELDSFMRKFVHTDNAMESIRKRRNYNMTNETKLKTFSPGRNIVAHRLEMVSPSKSNLRISNLTNKSRVKKEEQKDRKKNRPKVPQLKMTQNSRSRISIHTSLMQDNENVLVEKSDHQNLPRYQPNVDLTGSHLRVTQSLASFNYGKGKTKGDCESKVMKVEESKSKTPQRNLKKTPQREMSNLASSSHLIFKYRDQVKTNYTPNQTSELERTPNSRQSSLAPSISRSRISYAESKYRKMNDSTIKEEPEVAPKSKPKPLPHTPYKVVKENADNQAGHVETKRKESGVKAQSRAFSRNLSRGRIKIYKQPRDQALPQKIPRVSVSITKHAYNQAANPKQSFPARTPQRNLAQKIETTGKPVTNQKSRQLEIFSNSLFNIIQEEKMLEDSRKRLASRIDFFPSELFKMVDKDNKGKFTFEEFRQFLSLIGVVHTDTRSLIDLYSYFDSNQNCQLTQDEFNMMIVPHDPNVSVNFDRLPATNFEGPSEETLQLLASCFNRLFSIKKTISRTKKILKENSIDLNMMFEVINSRGNGFIQSEDVVRFLTENIHGYKESNLEEVSLFINRCDLDKDSRISFKDFYIFFSF